MKDLKKKINYYGRHPLKAACIIADKIRTKARVFHGNHKKRLSKTSVQAYRYEDDFDFSGMKTDIKVIALYLPQFHTFKENDEWWGKGFTEWTNVRKSVPRFEGHYQPRVPHDDMGYYDLSYSEEVERQIALAKQHGIHAFGVYYYWFSGKQLMTIPLDFIAQSKSQFLFFAIWANENFTRRWDGTENEILMEQRYTSEDPIKFIDSLEKYLVNPAYMRVDGKPVIGIYRPDEIPNAKKVFETWRKRCREIGVGEIVIWSCITDRKLDRDYYAEIDGEYEFPPRGHFFVKQEHMPGRGRIFDYLELVKSSRRFPEVPFHLKNRCLRGTMAEWDNSARKKFDYFVWKNYSAYRFYVWNRISIGYMRANYDADHRYLFVNAWNEWGEGAYLEPDERYGYRTINTLSRAIYDLPYSSEENEVIHYVGSYRDDSVTGPFLDDGSQKSVAVCVYVSDLERLESFLPYLESVPEGFDFIVVTSSSQKLADVKEQLSKEIVKAGRLYIGAVSDENMKGLSFLADCAGNYGFLCYIDIESLSSEIADTAYEKYLYQNVLGSENLVLDIMNLLQSHPESGIAFPQSYRCGLGGGCHDNLPAYSGKAFWARGRALCASLKAYLGSSYSEKEIYAGGSSELSNSLRAFQAEMIDGRNFLVTRNVLDDFELWELEKKKIQ